MVSSVGTLSSHYDTLGVAPTASDEEISRAFAEQMRTARMRPDIAVARLARLSVAFETLRNPAKRRAYDSSLGLNRPTRAAIPASAAPFIGFSTIDRLNRLAAASPPPAQVAPGPAATEPHVEPRIAGFIAASLRQPAQHREPEIRREPPPPPPAEAHPKPAEPTLTQPAESLDFEDGSFLIGRTGATLAACVIGVAILSVALAVPAPNPDRLPAPEASAQPALTVALPPAAATEDSAAAPEAPATAAELTATQPQAARDAVRVTKKAPSAPAMPVDGRALAAAATALSAAQSSAPEAAEQNAAVSSAVDTPSDDAANTAAAAISARLPLADATVARTIHRIGYACGRVVSTTAIDHAADGVFKVTCSSGDSYQATPVRGRYHFRRLGSR